MLSSCAERPIITSPRPEDISFVGKWRKWHTRRQEKSMLRTGIAFASGVVVGWVARGVLGTEREVLVRTLVLVTEVKDRVTRLAAEQVEWWQDLVAEARARVDLHREAASPDEDSQAKVIRVA
jgi:hypothetical protein